MPVNSPLDKESLNDLIQQFALAQLIDLQLLTQKDVIDEYLLITQQGHYKLTLFKKINQAFVCAYGKLIEYFASQGLPVPNLLKNEQGKSVVLFQSIPVLMMNWVQGSKVEAPSLVQCAKVGELLAKFHIISQSLPSSLPLQGQLLSTTNPLHSDKVESLLNLLLLSDALLLQEELGFHKTQEFTLLPQGLIHGQWTRTSILFLDKTISGIKDFYNIHKSDLLLDLALAVHDWCQDEQGNLHEEKLTAMINAYQLHRPWTIIEKQHWLAVRRTAALQGWIEQLFGIYFPQDKNLPNPKPDVYKHILQTLSVIPNF